jgi:myo-inositol-1(or 4)-monophosphatase
MSTASPTLNIMIKAARRPPGAGARLRRGREPAGLDPSPPGDFVSKADLKAGEGPARGLTDARPNYGWLGEESGRLRGQGPDPALDRRSARRHHQLPARHAALGDLDRAGAQGRDRRRRRLRPAKDEMFVAEKGAGAYLNDRRLRVSRAARHDRHACSPPGIPFGGRRPAPTLQDLARLMPRCAGVRRLGAAALDLAYVAAGRLDGLLGARAQRLGHRGRAPAGARGRRAVGAIGEGRGPADPGTSSRRTRRSSTPSSGPDGGAPGLTAGIRAAIRAAGGHAPSARSKRRCARPSPPAVE